MAALTAAGPYARYKSSQRYSSRLRVWVRGADCEGRSEPRLVDEAALLLKRSLSPRASGFAGPVALAQSEPARRLYQFVAGVALGARAVGIEEPRAGACFQWTIRSPAPVFATPF